MVSSMVYPSLERKPGGPDNWVERAGGLPKYIERIAKHLHYEKGMSISRAIAVAVNTVKRWARMGGVVKYGDPHNKHVTAKTAALAAAAVAEWVAKRAAGKLNLTEAEFRLIELSMVSEEYALHLADDLLDDEGEVVDLSSDTPEQARTGAAEIQHATLSSMDITALADRANRIDDPALRAAARQKVLDLAVPASKLTVDKRKGYASKGQAMNDGSFPIFDQQSLRSAVRLARTPAQRRHAMRRARALSLTALIPGSWSISLSELAVEGLLDLASTIAPRHMNGRAKDGRRSYKNQGHYKHGFIPVDQAAKEAKAKGSPIAIKRLNRLYSHSAKGRAGGRSASAKVNPKTVNVDESSFPGSEKANSLGALVRSPFQQKDNKNVVSGGRKGELPTTQKEASKSSRIPERARQDWDQIPANLKTMRNGKRFVLAEFGGKGYITPWVGGVHQVSQTSLDKRIVYRTLSTATAAKMSSAQLRDVLNNPKTGAVAKAIARKQLKTLAKESK